MEWGSMTAPKSRKVLSGVDLKRLPFKHSRPVPMEKMLEMGGFWGQSQTLG